jgi:hypothetical protein
MFHHTKMMEVQIKSKLYLTNSQRMLCGGADLGRGTTACY